QAVQGNLLFVARQAVGNANSLARDVIQFQVEIALRVREGNRNKVPGGSPARDRESIPVVGLDQRSWTNNLRHVPDAQTDGIVQRVGVQEHPAHRGIGGQGVAGRVSDSR